MIIRPSSISTTGSPINPDQFKDADLDTYGLASDSAPPTFSESIRANFPNIPLSLSVDLYVKYYLSASVNHGGGVGSACQATTIVEYSVNGVSGPYTTIETIALSRTTNGSESDNSGIIVWTTSISPANANLVKVRCQVDGLSDSGNTSSARSEGWETWISVPEDSPFGYSHV